MRYGIPLAKINPMTKMRTTAAKIPLKIAIPLQIETAFILCVKPDISYLTRFIHSESRCVRCSFCFLTLFSTAFLEINPNTTLTSRTKSRSTTPVATSAPSCTSPAYPISMTMLAVSTRKEEKMPSG